MKFSTVKPAYWTEIIKDKYETLALSNKKRTMQTIKVYSLAKIIKTATRICQRWTNIKK